MHILGSVMLTLGVFLLSRGSVRTVAMRPQVRVGSQNSANAADDQRGVDPASGWPVSRGISGG